MGFIFGSGDSTITGERDGVLVYSWQYSSLNIPSINWPDIVSTARGYGQCVVQSHQSDWSWGEIQGTIPELLSYLQNSTELMTMTEAQWYDIRHGSLEYYTSDDHSVIDLTDCIDDHAVWLDRSMMGECLFVDETTGEPAPQMKVTSDFAILYAHKGHTYRSVPLQVSPRTDQTAYVWLKNYSVVNDSSDGMEVEVAQTSGTCEFVVEGLYQGQEWEISVDGELQVRLAVNASGAFSWTYSGDWSTHTFTFVRVQTISEAISSMMPMVFGIMVVGVIIAMVGIVFGATGSKKH
jgi:hypothetical protein